MPISVNDVDADIEVESPGGSADAPRTEPPAEALPRWQELARREQQQAARTAAWGFDD